MMRISIVLIAIFYTVSMPVRCETLHTGTWTGSYTPYRSESVDAEFIVTNLETAPGLKITMMLDFQPREEFTYELEQILVKDNIVTFSITKPHETKSCSLEKQADGAYAGTCQSNIDNDNKRLTSILMIPPSNTENEDKNSGEDVMEKPAQ